MALTLPKGIVFGFAPITATSNPVTGFTRASPAVATGTTVATGSVVVIRSPNWTALNNRVSVVDATKGLSGIDTTDTVTFPGTSGAGELFVAGPFVNFSQQGEPSSAGGEQQFWTGQLLEDRSGRQIQLPTFKNVKTLTLPLYYDASLPWYNAAKAVDSRGEPVAVRMLLANGDAIYNYGYMSFDSDPTIAANTPMGNVATFSFLSESTLVRAAV
ncbi:P12 [Xanthomonas phage phiL7]|uniref:p12 n=1 Tax=Xanthomonas phage phiL7 TaxID=538979 RepID=C4ML12_9CAUD|nr:major tail protein [Xanthomonas phage phiL7]ACE75752.1 P12 [Xanthomonas phage phiL7]